MPIEYPIAKTPDLDPVRYCGHIFMTTDRRHAHVCNLRKHHEGPHRHDRIVDVWRVFRLDGEKPFLRSRVLLSVPSWDAEAYIKRIGYPEQYEIRDAKEAKL